MLPSALPVAAAEEDRHAAALSQKLHMVRHIGEGAWLSAFFFVHEAESDHLRRQAFDDTLPVVNFPAYQADVLESDGALAFFRQQKKVVGRRSHISSEQTQKPSGQSSPAVSTHRD